MRQSFWMTTALAAGLVAAGSALAQDRRAVVIANSNYAAPLTVPQVRKDGEDLSEVLFGLGFIVDRIENADLATMQSALAEVADHDGPLVIYFAGHGYTAEGASYLRPLDSVETGPDTGLPVADLLGPDRIVVLDTCHGPASQQLPAAGALDPGLAGLAEATDNLVLIAAATPGQACPEFTETALAPLLLERLELPGLPATQLVPEEALAPAIEEPAAPVAATDAPDPAATEELADTDSEEDILPAPPVEGVWVASSRTEPFVFRRATSGTRLTTEDYAMLETLSPAARAQLLALWESQGIVADIVQDGPRVSATPTIGTVENETVVLTEPVRPVNSANTVAPVTLSAGTVARVTDGVSILAAPTTPQVSSAPRPVPGAGGLPRPSIIVGFPEELETASFETVPEDAPGVDEVAATALDGAGAEALGGSELSYDNLEARVSLREGDPDLFASLVDGGAFDPPAQQVALALQTELQRMNCYRSVLDNDWGPGSRRALVSYYEERGTAAPSQDATVEVYRAMIAAPDVRCPDPVVQAAPQRTTSSNTTRRQTTTTQSAPRRTQTAPAPAPAPAAPAPTQRRTLSNSGGTGIFR